MTPISQSDIDAMKEKGYDVATIAEAEAQLQLFERSHSVIQQIRTAFSDVRLDDGIGLQESRGLDDYEDPETLAKYRSQDEKDDWEKIPASELNVASGGLCFFDAAGMRFHLPAYLIADLRGEYNFDLMFNLTTLDDYALSQFSLLNQQQRLAVRAFLLLCLDDPECQWDWDHLYAALLSYWVESEPTGA